MFTQDLDGSTYARRWQDLRRREILFRLITVFYVPVVLAALLALNALHNDVPEHFGAWAGVGGIAGFLSAALYRQRFRCPRCGEFFFRQLIHYREEAQSCTHCHLPLGAQET
jgi:hypothetical protein